MTFQLLSAFAGLFHRQIYHHRRSTLGDTVAQHLFEDLYHLGHSGKLVARIDGGACVLNVKNRAHGIQHRRGDGTLGTIIPGDEAIRDSGFVVGRGPIASIEIGVELKVLAKAMIKQIDRVKNDLRRQSSEFRKGNDRAVTVAIVGVNHARVYRSFEGPREYVTDGRKYAHPVDEAAQAISHLTQIRAEFDEFLVLRFTATNLEPFPFQFVDPDLTRRDYGSMLVRISNLYDQRF